MSSITEEKLYEEYHDKVFGYIFNHTSHKEDAEDLTNDVFLKAFRSLNSFDESKASVSTWIFTIMRNTLTDHFRRGHISEELDEDFVSSDDIEGSYLRKETLEELADALKELPQEQRDIIILKYYDGLSLTEISEKLDISYGMIKVKHKNALFSMQKLLSAGKTVEFRRTQDH
ncbi:MAG: sigma-70 family RNA polymerase sigma factor [Lachnospiraceae bacterium]|nr:sigma-70 family RNA polymerase sigma factor [Lachnospiraceae bacterium]